MRSDAAVVFDCNVLVSAAAFPTSLPRKALDFVLENGTILLSADLILELEDVLHRPKLQKYISPNRATAFVAYLASISHHKDVTSRVDVCRDGDDNRVLELALDGHADAIVTGDQDLLGLTSFQGIPILTPRQFIEALAPASLDEPEQVQ